jgi:hypothetical protein
MKVYQKYINMVKYYIDLRGGTTGNERFAECPKHSAKP